MPGSEDVPPERRIELDAWPTWPDRLFHPEREHRCPAMEEQERLRGRMEVEAADRNVVPDELLYGRLIERIEFAAGRWWALNDEYSTSITFCPFCGTRLT